MVVKETENFKKKPSILHKGNRKDATKASLKLAGLHPMQVQRFKGLSFWNSFKSPPRKREIWVVSPVQKCLGQCSSFPATLAFRSYHDHGSSETDCCLGWLRHIQASSTYCWFYRYTECKWRGRGSQNLNLQASVRGWNNVCSRARLSEGDWWGVQL